MSFPETPISGVLIEPLYTPPEIGEYWSQRVKLAYRCKSRKSKITSHKSGSTIHIHVLTVKPNLLRNYFVSKFDPSYTNALLQPLQTSTKNMIQPTAVLIALMLIGPLACQPAGQTSPRPGAQQPTGSQAPAQTSKRPGSQHPIGSQAPGQTSQRPGSQQPIGSQAPEMLLAVVNPVVGWF
ncbi:unnamed protein product, partial [Didymodactylos carnosus]